MKDLAERLWPAFRAEVTEQLEALELLLVRPAGAAVDASAEAVNAMFRHFHTIKGGCSMMGFVQMGALAHAAEDALDPVRRNERALDDTLVDALLDATDALGGFLARAGKPLPDGGGCDALVARLRAQTPAAGVAAAAALESASTLPAEAPQRAALEQGLQAFAAQAPALLAAALDTPLPAASQAALLALRAAAESAGLVAVAQLLRALQVAGDDAHLRLCLAADIGERLRELQQQAGIDAGIDAAVQARTGTLDAQLQETVAAITAALTAGDDAQALAAAESLAALAMLAAMPQTARLARLVCQLLRDVTRRGLVADAALRELLLMAATLPLELAAPLQEDAPYAALAGTVYRRLADAVGRAASGADMAALREQLRSVAPVRAEWLDLLPEAALQRLQRALQEGRLLAEIDADMEGAADNGAAFVTWLDEAGAQLGNQTVFRRDSSEGDAGESTQLRFLVAWPHPEAELRRALAQLDPSGTLFRCRLCTASAMADESLETAPPGEGVAGAPATRAATRPDAMTPRERAAPREAAAARGNATLRVDSDAVDRFVSRIGELVTLRNSLSHALQADDMGVRQRRARELLARRQTRPLREAEFDELQQLLDELDERQRRLMQADLRLQGALGRMQEDVLALRVVPLSGVFNRLPRVVRDLAGAQGKQVRFAVSGEDVRVDKSLVELLIEPLMHLVRNAVDHGIETPDLRVAAGKPALATLAIQARQQGGVLLVEVIDDGRGLDLERIRARALERGLLRPGDAAASGEELAQLIFLPGFSTAQEVTEVSGRGVGMDVARTRILQAGGHLDVASQAGQGTRFTLRLPLSVAIQPVVLVQAGRRQLALPDRSVHEIIGVPAGALQSVQGQACCLLRGAMLPVYSLDALLGGDAGARAASRLEIVVIGDGRHRIGLLVDRVLGRPEVYVRDAHEDIAKLPGVAGVSVLGDGDVVLILDGEQLLELALRRAQALRSLLRVS